MQTKAAKENWSPADLIDLARYPILDLNGDVTRELTRHCRDQLDRTGACELPGFLTPDSGGDARARGRFARGAARITAS